MPDKIDKAVIATTTVSGAAATTGGIMTYLGFTSTGIAASSTAAAIQGGIGNVIGGSAFAVLQSLGAKGIFAIMGFAGGVGLGIGALYGAYKFIKRK